MNEQSKQITLDIPDGYDIDIENSDLKNGVIKFKPIEKQLPKTWEEFCKTHPVTEGEYYVDSWSKIELGEPETRRFSTDRNLGTKETCEAVLALMQLIQLRDCYNTGWVPNWSNLYEQKYVIFRDCDDICKNRLTTFQCVLNFKTAELRDQFLENFKELIEVAKPLI